MTTGCKCGGSLWQYVETLTRPMRGGLVETLLPSGRQNVGTCKILVLKTKRVAWTDILQHGRQSELRPYWSVCGRPIPLVRVMHVMLLVYRARPAVFDLQTNSATTWEPPTTGGTRHWLRLSTVMGCDTALTTAQHGTLVSYVADVSETSCIKDPGVDRRHPMHEEAFRPTASANVLPANCLAFTRSHNQGASVVDVLDLLLLESQ